MPKHVDIEAVERAARAKLNTRVEAVKALAAARQHTLEKQAEAAAAEREDTTAWMAAIRQGWSEDELKDLGFHPPGRRGPGRPRRRRTPTRSTAATRDADEATAGARTAHDDDGAPATAEAQPVR